MATREENLKKINDELEKLNDKQLDEIAGGFGILYNEFRNRNDDTVNEIDTPHALRGCVASVLS